MIYFVADYFVEQYEGGAELTTEAIIQNGYFPCNKILSADPSLKQLMKNQKDAFWIFGNFSGVPEDCMLYAAKELNYSVLEYDYKYCEFRSSGKHTEAEGQCSCENTRHGKLVSIFLSKASSTWWMSDGQLKHYQSLFPFLKNSKNRILSSCFSKEKLSYINSLKTDQKNNKFLILNSPSWIKGADDAVAYAKENNLEYELVWGLKHKDLLAKLAESRGIIFFPKAYDTCPRMTIEARLLDCELILNDNVQHKNEDWFTNKETTLEYLKENSQAFWNEIEKTATKNLNLPIEANSTPASHCFKIIIPFYNCEKWIHKCLQSIKRQNYKNFKCILIDDISTDNSAEIIEDVIKGDDRFALITNKEKKFALANIVDAIDTTENEEDDVIILLDGDDWLASSKTLDKLCDAYTDDVLMTYGSYVYNPTGKKGVEPSEYPEDVIKTNSFRKDIWRASHLRTFKYKLWKHLDKNDLKKDNEYYEMTYDQAIMLPLLEMSAERSKYIPEVLHVYNKENPLNVDKIKAQKQSALAREIREKKPYTRI